MSTAARSPERTVVQKRNISIRRQLLAVCYLAFNGAASVVFLLSSAVSIWTVWSSKALSDHRDAVMSGLIFDPLARGVALIATCGATELVYALMWIIIGAPLWLLPQDRHRNKLTSFMTGEFSATVLLVHVFATFYLAYMDHMHPNLHPEPDLIVTRTLETESSSPIMSTLRRQRLTNVVEVVEHDEADPLALIMRTYRRTKRCMMILYACSCCLKTIFLKYHQKLKNLPPPNARGLIKVHEVGQPEESSDGLEKTVDCGDGPADNPLAAAGPESDGGHLPVDAGDGENVQPYPNGPEEIDHQEVWSYLQNNPAFAALPPENQYQYFNFYIQNLQQQLLGKEGQVMDADEEEFDKENEGESDLESVSGNDEKGGVVQGEVAGNEDDLSSIS